MTRRADIGRHERRHFNPHEREARDGDKRRIPAPGLDFNPHEREARDAPEVKPLRLHNDILIHTSVKLVTHSDIYLHGGQENFNPHEREARDCLFLRMAIILRYFNPHEREARDPAVVGVGHPVSDFNPHEREARDQSSHLSVYKANSF